MKPIFILENDKIIEQFNSFSELNDYLHKINRHLNENEEAYFSYNFLCENPDYFIEFCTNKQLIEEIEGRMFDFWYKKVDKDE